MGFGRDNLQFIPWSRLQIRLTLKLFVTYLKFIFTDKKEEKGEAKIRQRQKIGSIIRKRCT